MIFSLSKVYYLILQIIFFSIIYYFLQDDEFGGINVVQEMIREEIVRRHIESDIEGFQTYQSTFDNNSNYPQLDQKSQRALEKESNRVEQDTKQEIKQAVRAPWWQDYFNRLYFSVVTGTTLGYGDIYPISNRCKLCVIAQLISTIMIVSF